MVQGETGFCTRWDHGGPIRDDFLEVLEQKIYHLNFRDRQNFSELDIRFLLKNKVVHDLLIGTCM